MFGKVQVPATVVAAELVKTSEVESNHGHEVQTWHHVVDVRAPGEEPFRTMVKTRFWGPRFLPPEAKEEILVDYRPGHPNSVELALEGSDWDQDRYKTSKSDLKAAQKARNSALEATLNPPPGTPSATPNP
jgi:hypothetical protein